MQKFAVSLTIASLAVALNIQDEGEAVPTLINIDPVEISEGDIEATENTPLGIFGLDVVNDLLPDLSTPFLMTTAEQEGEADDVEEEDADIYDQLDENEDEIPDIFQRVLQQYAPEEEDCSCRIEHGLPVSVNELGNPFITVTF